MSWVIALLLLLCLGGTHIGFDTVRNVAGQSAVSVQVRMAREEAGKPGVRQSARTRVEDEIATEERVSRENSGKRVGQGPFRVVASLLGSSRRSQRVSLPARRQLAALQEIASRFSLPRSDIADFLSGAPSTLNPNPNPVVPDAPVDVSTSVSLDTCPYPVNTRTNGRCDLSAPFRTFDGTCNNIGRPLWGRSMTPLIRLETPAYCDGINTPRCASNRRALPNVRSISATLFKDNSPQSSVHTHFLMTCGQFLDHDLTRTAVSTLAPESAAAEPGAVACGNDGCETSGPANRPCLPITVSSSDDVFSSRRCLMFVRTQEVPQLDCASGPRQQLNQLTHYIDASNVYGSTKEEAEGLRDPTPSRGKLATTPEGNGHRPLLPQDDNPSCREVTDTIRCFKAGDERVNENVALTSIHTILTRVHNDIEERLNGLGNGWGREELFQQTRRIVGALWQHIVYNEYLPIILGPDLIREHHLGLQTAGTFSTAYDESVSAEVTNVFATAAFRFSHSMISGLIQFSNQAYNNIQSVPLSTVLERPGEVYNTNRPGGSGIDSITLGLLQQNASAVDRFFSREVTQKLFSEDPPTQPGTDLVSLNLQRGRDHGIPGYNAWRKRCDLTPAQNFNRLTDIKEPLARRVLKQLYTKIDDVDLFAGAMSEKRVAGGMVGPTFGCILAEQFRRSMVGDRFWYETNDPITGFTIDQLDEIRKVTLSSLVCQGLDSVTSIQRFAMLRPFSELGPGVSRSQAVTMASLYAQDDNERRPCSQLPYIDFQKWRVQ